MLILLNYLDLKAIAGEAGVPFFYKAGSEFEEMYVDYFLLLLSLPHVQVMPVSNM